MMSAFSNPYSRNPEGTMFAMFGGSLLFMIVFPILFIIAEGITIDMISDAYSGGRANLSKSFGEAKSKAGSLLVAAVIVGVVLAIGYMLLIIPGLILTVLLYFVAQSIMIDNKSAVESLTASYNFVKNNFVDSIVIILLSGAISFVASIIPLLGILLLLAGIPLLISLPTILYIDRR
jgi:uncharacterized membrane protein